MKTRQEGDLPPLCLGKAGGEPLPGERARRGKRCGVSDCEWAFECVNGAVTIEVEADAIIVGESGGV